MTASQELVAAVRARTEDTPYTVTETSDGFTVQIDFANASWYALLYKEHLSQTWVYHAKLDDAARTIAVTDEVKSVEWRAGAQSRDGVPTPFVQASVSGAKGRFEVRSTRKVFAVSEQGRYEKVLDHDFSSGAGRALILEPARELGWTEVRGTAEKIGLYVAVATVALLLVGGVAVGLLFLLGVL